MDKVKKNINDDGFSYKKRIFLLVDNLFDGNGASFLREANLSHNYLQRLKNQDNPIPSIEAINKMIDAAKQREEKFNPLWLIRDEGEMIDYRFGNIEKYLASEPEQGPGGAFIQALEAIQRIEQQPGEVKDTPLPPDLELRLARLLTKLLERRYENEKDEDS